MKKDNNNLIYIQLLNHSFSKINNILYPSLTSFYREARNKTKLMIYLDKLDQHYFASKAIATIANAIATANNPTVATTNKTQATTDIN